MKLEPISKKIAYEGSIIRFIETEMSNGQIFERAVRSPGTRTIVYDVKKDQLLLTREYRYEINDYDYRLPGGKVRDSIKEWDEIKDSPNINEVIKDAAKKEVREEAAIEITDLHLFTTSASGGPTIEWTLYYLVADNFKKIKKQDRETPEIEVTGTCWLASKKVIDLCLTGKMKEGRSVAALLQFMHSINKI